MTEFAKLPPAAALPIGPKFEVLMALPPNVENLAIHPLADEWPMADPHEQKSLEGSIKELGILQGIVLYWDDDGKLKILDGRNRYKGAEEVSHKFTPENFKVFKGDLAAAAAFVEAVNGHRRHMTQEQKEARALRLIAKNPHLSARKLALIVGLSHTTITKLRKPKEEDGFKTLARAWENATVSAQEQFVQTFRIDLAELLKV
jgi:ParB-like chromosome segregation protein Spo0J